MNNIRLKTFLAAVLFSLNAEAIIEQSLEQASTFSRRSIIVCPYHTGWPEGGCIRPSIISILRMAGLVH